jgi:DNA-binding Xre family transcriptional regulator
MTIRLRLKELYIERGKTQKQVSDEANLREATLSQLSNNKKALLDVEILDRLCHYFELKDISELIEFNRDNKYSFNERINENKNRK